MDGFYDSPPCAASLRRAVMALRKEYRGLKVFSAGRSAGGRNILALALGEVRGAPLYVGGIHGDEWLTTLLLMRFMEALLEGLRRGTPLAGMELAPLLGEGRLVMVPCLNPDGLEICSKGPGAAGQLSGYVRGLWQEGEPWRANLRGVDLDRNFDAGWRARREPGPWGSSGCKPFSEPESRCAANLCAGLGVRSLYVFGRGREEILYRSGGESPPRSALMAQVLSSACGCRPAAARPVQGGFADWFIQHTGRPAFVLSAGGRAPDTVEELAPALGRLAEAMVLGMLL